MKAAPFDYVRPATVDEAVAALAGAGEDGKVLAGGQSLVPVLAMRLGRPAVLVDINAVTGLNELACNGEHPVHRRDRPPAPSRACPARRRRPAP